MNKLFKIKNFLIIQTTAITFVVFSFIVGIYGVSVSLLNWLKRLFGDSFSVCINMGPDPAGYSPTLPCFYGNVLILDMVLMILVVVYFFVFVIYRLNNKTTN